MKPIEIYQVDAFTDRLFRGNPAAICPLETWLPDTVMQAVAAENNLSETAFFVVEKDGYALRWFTPKNEIDLCGHATLATAHVLFCHLGVQTEAVRFSTRFAGPLSVARKGDWLALDFPAWMPQPLAAPPQALIAAMDGLHPRETLVRRDYLLVYENEADVRNACPDFSLICQLDRDVCITAPGTGCDFVSRFFCAEPGIGEDPVTGSAHSMLIPYWAGRLGKSQMLARQLSERGGELRCELKGERVRIAGQAITYLKGTIFI
jgi:PhzF family phenazine biosynthesis protein